MKRLLMVLLLFAAPGLSAHEAWLAEKNRLYQAFEEAWAPPTRFRDGEDGKIIPLQNLVPKVDPRTQIGAGAQPAIEGLAHWVLAEILLRYNDPYADAASRWHIARAAQMLDSDIPLYHYLEGSSSLLTQMTPAGASEPDPANRTNALPLLLLAKSLGAPSWTEFRLRACETSRVDLCYPPEELAQGPRVLAELLADLATGPPPEPQALKLKLDREMDAR